MLSTTLCDVCGKLASLRCSRCGGAYYCCAQHQKIHWKIHKEMCKTKSAGDQKENEDRATNRLSTVIPTRVLSAIQEGRSRSVLAWVDERRGRVNR